MAMNIDTMDFFWENLKALNRTKLKGVWMMELGNQTIRQPTKDKYKIHTGKSKVYFLGLRCNHHSIDQNGKDGAIPLDLTQPIPIPRFMNAFEIVTDFGCLEHVRGLGSENKESGQWQAWKNIHNMGRVDCVYMHTIPMLGSFVGHGSFHYMLKFFEDLCKANDYEIVFLRRQSVDPRTDTRGYIFCSYLKKVDALFVPEAKEFKEWLHR